jgi:coenzyme F420-reducing hydrogenase beta subunit
MYQADVTNHSVAFKKSASAVCPFSNEGPDEDSIGEGLYGVESEYDSRTGYYKDLYVGYVAEDDFRAKGTSGGIITWLASELLKTGSVDAVVHVKKVENPDDGILFRYAVSRTEEEVAAGAKSRYYPVEMSEVVQQIKEVSGSYVIIGLPCFIKAIRRAALVDPVLNDRVKFCIGLVCGHLKSRAFADCFGWQAGISPGHLEEVDFRVKLPGRTAGDYGVYLRGDGKEITRPTRDFLGSNWGHNFFRYPACDFCDDVFAETADVVIGDAWLPEYDTDPHGTSIVVVRNSFLSGLIKEGVSQNRLRLESSCIEDIVMSQAGGLRDRREGLAYRLWLGQKCGWVPRKRVSPTKKSLPLMRKLIYSNRQSMGAKSHLYWRDALDRDDFDLFSRKMKRLISINRFFYSGFPVRVCRQIKKQIIALKNLR